jgi:nucleotide-binding universal stress UspA family protein
MAYTKLLVGVDFSPESDLAVQQALSIARSTGAELVLVHVGVVAERPDEVPPSMRATADAYYGVLAEHLRGNRDRLEELRERLSGQGAPVSQLVVDGFADAGLVDAATQLGGDLIAVGTHGRTGLKRFFLGSVAEKVVRTAHTSVLVARGSADAAVGGFHHLVVGTDFSHLAEHALDAALEVAAPGAVIDVINCWALPALGAVPEAGLGVAGVEAELRTAMRVHAEELGAKLISSRRGPSRTLHFHAIEATPADGIDEWARTHGGDLVVVASHGRRGVRRLLLGSVAEVTVRHAPCSVLVVRTENEEDED